MSYDPSMATSISSLQPKTVVIRRKSNQGFGFTLRHFIAYPPDNEPYGLREFSYHEKGMETIFIKEVHPNSPAFHANLQTGDRILMVNHTPISGLAYSTIVSMIKQTPELLTLHVVPKECDILQMHYDSIAHAPETNRVATHLSTDSIKADIDSSEVASHRSLASDLPNNCHSLFDEFRSSNQQQNSLLDLEAKKTFGSTARHSYESNRTQQYLYPRQPFLNSHSDTKCVHPMNVPLPSSHQRDAILQASLDTYNNDLMYRLRQSIKQKEEFLKSPSLQESRQHQHQAHFFPKLGSNETYLSKINSSSSIKTVSSYEAARNSSSTALRSSKQPLIISSSKSSIKPGPQSERSLESYESLSSKIVQGNQPISSFDKNSAYVNEKCPNSGIIIGLDSSSSDGLQDTGVTNKVFETKLVSRFPKEFNPFKQLSINTNDLENDFGNATIKAHSDLPKFPSQIPYENPPPVPPHNPNVIFSTKPRSSRHNSLDACYLMVNDHPNPNPDKKEISLDPVMKSSQDDSSREVFRRSKPSNSNAINDNKHMRRISYLRATNNLEQSDTSPVLLAPLEPILPSYGHDLAESRFVEETKTNDVDNQSKENSDVLKQNSCQIQSSTNNYDYLEKDMEVFEADLEMKSTCINGKRSSDYRSWKPVKIEIIGDNFKIHPYRNSKSDNGVINLNLKNFIFCDESIDKKKNVFRMQSKTINKSFFAYMQSSVQQDGDKLIGSQSSQTISSPNIQTDILFKTKSYTEMIKIVGLLQWKSSLNYENDPIPNDPPVEVKKSTELSRVNGSTTIFFEPPDRQLQVDLSPSSSTTKYDTDVSNSTSPSMKTRKSSSYKNCTEKELASPKSKNWKDLLFRRGGGMNSSNSDSSSLPSSTAKLTCTGSIGVPLKSCPMSKNNEYVPHIVEACTNIVESKGLGIVGIYRIPGNKAAISELSEQVNKSDFSWDQCDTDVRWEDVNVVSSLLKLFIRSLPDALLPSSFYYNFIQADKKVGLARVTELKDLITSLPPHSYETLKHLIRHLNRISHNCEVNLMEPKNLAIIFGPSIIRTPNDTLEIAVKDMKHQCRIVELLVSQYDYFFENGSTPNLCDLNGANVRNSTAGVSEAVGCDNSQEEQTNMLLDNVSKIERFGEKETSKTSRFIPQLRRRTHSKRGGVSSDTYSGESVLSLDSNKHFLSVDAIGTSNTTQETSSSLSYSSSASHFTKKTTTTVSSKKKDRISFLGSRSHLRKTSLNEKDSESGSGTSCSKELDNGTSVDISMFLTDEESSQSRLSDTGSMSLTTVTDTLDTKLKNLRSGSESNDENDPPEYLTNRRHTLGQPLYIHSENIPYADESPERQITSFNSLEYINTLALSRSQVAGSHSHEVDQKLQPSAAPNRSSNNSVAFTSPLSNSNMPLSSKFAVNSKQVIPRNSHICRQQLCSDDDDSEGSTTSNPKENLAIKYVPGFQERYTKKRRDMKLFRSASFNCRNHLTKSGNLNGGQATCHSSGIANLTKDEKTDMNLTKKRQIQIKQNRSIKRRHTVGGPHDYAADTVNVNCNKCCKKNINKKSSLTRRTSIPSENKTVEEPNLASRAATGSLSLLKNTSGDHLLDVASRKKSLNINKARQ